MKEYIERTQLLKNLGYDEKRRADVLPGSTFDIVLKEPAADVTPVVHARWEDGSHGDAKCPVCGREDMERNYNYCPHCGAKMDG